MSMATLTAIGTVVLILMGVLLVVLLGYALRILLTIYSIFNSGKREGEENRGNRLLQFAKSAGVIEIIIFLLRNRGQIPSLKRRVLYGRIRVLTVKLF